MKQPPKSPLRQTSGKASSMEEIEEIRTRLARAQSEENAAIRKLGRLTQEAHANRKKLDKLLAEARSTRERAISVYKELEKALGTVERMAEGERATGSKTDGSDPNSN